MKREAVNHPTARGAEAGILAGIIAAVVAGVVSIVIADGSFFAFPEYVADVLFVEDNGMGAIIFGYAIHFALSALFGGVYAYFAHWADFDRFETPVPLMLGAMLYAVALYVMTFTLFVGLFSQTAGEVSLVVSMSMVFVYSITLAMMLWRPRVIYKELDHGATDMGSTPQVRAHKAPNDPPAVK